MSTISTILSTLRSAVWAIDVRDEIADAIEQCYKDVNSPSLVTDGIEEVIGDMVDNGRISGAIVEDLGLITEGTSNLFDFTTVTAGRLNTSTGEVGEASGYWTSDYIAVESEKTYYFANTDRRVAYNSSKAYSANISGTTWTASANGYVRVSVTSANRKTAKINEGSAKDYRPGRSPIDFNLRDDVYRKAEVDAALAAVTIATDPELETAGAAADAKATGDAISALNESLGDAKSVLFDEGSIPKFVISKSGYKLNGDGGGIEDENSIVNVYEVVESEWLYLKLSADNAGTYQFQDNAVINTRWTEHVKGRPVSGTVDEFVKVPEGATRLLVSQFLTNETNVIKKANSVSELVRSQIGNLTNLITTDKDNLVSAINEVKSGNVLTDNTLSIAQKPADSKTVGDKLSNTGKTLASFRDNLYLIGNKKVADATTNGYALTGKNGYARNSNSVIYKYAVTEGELLYLKLSADNAGTYQFQNHVSITNTGEHVIGIPVSGEVDYFVVVPTGATYLMVSQFLTNEYNEVRPATLRELVDETKIGRAVGDWLEDHPEATSTVADGSITKEKLSDGTLLELINDYVTPEMYGALGDGTTDDTQAIKEMFSSGNFIFKFSDKTYIIKDSIDISYACSVYFNNTIIKAKYYPRELNTYEYMIGVRTAIRTYGSLKIDADSSVKIGLFLSGCGGSYFEKIKVSNATIWGICMDKNVAGCNGIHFGALGAAYCGQKLHAKMKYVSNDTAELTDISGYGTNNISDAKKMSFFDGTYRQSGIILDDSGYTNSALHNRYTLFSSDTSIITLNLFDLSSGLVDYSIPSDYSDGDNGRDVFIPIGGGICFGSGASEGTYIIDNLSTQNCSVSFKTDMSYGGKIGSYSSEYDTLLVATGITYNLAVYYMYLEALGHYLTYKYHNQYDRIMLLCGTTDTNMYVYNGFIGAGRLKFFEANSVIKNDQTAANQNGTGVRNCLHGIDFLASSKLNEPNVIASNSKWTINEYSAKTLTQLANSLSVNNTITLSIRDVDNYWQNGFSPFEYYVKLSRTDTDHVCKIGLDSELVDEGYTIYGSVDNTISIDASSYDYCMKVTIILFGKQFCVKAESLSFIDNTNG